MRVAILTGGTGGARLAAGFQALPEVSRLTVVANTADDDEFWGLLVSPDFDAVLYRLAGMFNSHAGYGVANDSFTVLEALSARHGERAWFRIGDLDFATHALRTQLLRDGLRPAEVALELCTRFGVTAQVLPMTDERVRTRFMTDAGELSFQEYFVREQLRPHLRSIRIEGAADARPAPEVREALAAADLVVIGPSNPLISIAPILQVVEPCLRPERTVGVSPIVAGSSLKGPTVEMLQSLGLVASPVTVAAMWKAAASTFVLDERDRGLAPEVERLGYRVTVLDTVMSDGGRRLARALLDAV